MLFDNIFFIKKLWLKAALGFLLLIFAGNLYADSVRPISGEFNVEFVGTDPETGELVLEGPKTGALPGLLSIRAAVVRQTGVAMHLSARWTLTTTWGETMSGENTSVLNTKSLHFREHGVIVSATGSLTGHIDNFIVIHGQFNNLSFIPGLMEVNGVATIIPSQAKQR